MTILRLAVYFIAVQCVAAGAAFAGAPVPEPASMGLLAVGAAGIAVLHVIRKRK